MVQKIAIAGMTGSGIVAVLIIAGIIIMLLQVSEFLGLLAIFAGISIAIVLGILGIIGVANKVIK